MIHAQPGRLNITTRNHPGGTCLALGGDIAAYTANDLMTHALSQLHPVNPPGVLTLDLAEVRYLDPHGLRTLLKIRRACDSAGWTLAVVHLTSYVKHTINISGLAPILDPQPALPETDPTSPGGGTCSP